MKLVAIDMDGTLLRRDGSVEEADRRALAWLGERGVAVALVTGRLWSGACEVAAELGLGGPMGCVDGSHIVALDGADLQRRAIPADDARRIRALLGARGASLFRLAADGITYEPDGDRFAAYVSIWSPRIRRVDDHGVDPAWTDPDGILGMVAVGREAM
ncbi:MAG: HAD family hydrolase, partial [Myxococcota bacterium]